MSYDVHRSNAERRFAGTHGGFEKGWAMWLYLKILYFRRVIYIYLFYTYIHISHTHMHFIAAGIRVEARRTRNHT